MVATEIAERGVDFGIEDEAPEFKPLRRAYGFEEVAIVPGRVTLNPEQTDIRFAMGDRIFDLPILAAAMDGVVDPGFAATYTRYGGLAVLNLEGVHGRLPQPRRGPAGGG